MPVEIEVHTVSHFKATIYGTIEYQGLERAGTFM